MTDERTYGEDEVREILELAANRAEIGRPAALDGGGLTLSELQDAGREVGIEPGQIAEAAFAVDTRREVLPRRTYLGAPVSVGRVIDLPWAMTDREWEVLVGELRETFGVGGILASHGGVREWTHGNLHAYLEPTATGHRLRLGTHKGNAVPLITIGGVGMILGLALLTLFVFEGLGRAQNAFAILVEAVGGGIMATTMLRLPRWAREREGQMEYIAGRVGALLGDPPPGEEPGT